MNADESSWRESAEREGLDADGEVRTAVLLIAALMRQFPPSLRVQVLAQASELLTEAPSHVEQAVALAGDPVVGERFSDRVQRIVTDGAS